MSFVGFFIHLSSPTANILAENDQPKRVGLIFKKKKNNFKRDFKESLNLFDIFITCFISINNHKKKNKILFLVFVAYFLTTKFVFHFEMIFN